MRFRTLQKLLFTGALCALVSLSARAQTIEFRATINSAQETTGSTSTATGMAILLYDIPSNSFDLTVTINNMANAITASHIHEGAPGVAGPVVTNLGAESAIYVRNGNTVSTTLINVHHLGTPLTLLRNGAYLNFHTAAYPGGEVRGQLIAQPKRLIAILDGAHEVPVNASKAYGAAYISYDPGTNKISTRINVYNFTNTLSASHYHEAAVGVGGPVVHNLGGSAAYTKTGTAYGASFVSQTYLGDPIKLLTGGAYLNVHSNISPGGEIRGQVWTSEEMETARVSNMSARGFVGKGEQALINGFVITGNEPVRVLITARGPSLTALGVTGALANPMISLHDSSGTEIDVNDDYGTAFASADLASTGFGPTNASESALLLVLPPGVYTTVVTGVGDTTGVALTEVYEVRAKLGSSVTAQVGPGLNRMRLRQEYVAPPTKALLARAGLEFCVSAPVKTASTP